MQAKEPYTTITYSTHRYAAASVHLHVESSPAVAGCCYVHVHIPHCAEVGRQRFLLKTHSSLYRQLPQLHTPPQPWADTHHCPPQGRPDHSLVECSVSPDQGDQETRRLLGGSGPCLCENNPPNIPLFQHAAPTGGVSARMPPSNQAPPSINTLGPPRSCAIIDCNSSGRQAPDLQSRPALLHQLGG